jgi:hypothetical protein
MHSDISASATLSKQPVPVIMADNLQLQASLINFMKFFMSSEISDLNHEVRTTAYHHYG